MSRLSIRSTALLRLPIVLVVCLLTALAGCAADEFASDRQSEVAVDDAFVQGQHLLGQGQVHAARVELGQVAGDDPQFARAQVALALVELMLLPEHPGATSIFAALGADTARLPVDVERTLYGDDGLFARLHTGASADLVEAALYGALPWPEADLRSGRQAVFGRLDPAETFEALRPGVVEIEAALGNIEARLAHALEQGLDVYELPVGFMHSPRGRTLRRSDVLAMRAAIHGARGLLRTALAYSWPIALRAALAELDARDEPLTIDALAELWNDGMLRALSADGLDQLAAARVLFGDGLETLREAIVVGRAEERRGLNGPLEWLILDDAAAIDVDTLLADFASGTSSATPVLLRLADPRLYWTAAPVFTGQIVRAGDAPPLWVGVEASFGVPAMLELDENAVHQLLVAPLFEPAWSPDSPPDLLGHSALDTNSAATLTLQRFGEELSSDYNF